MIYSKEGLSIIDLNIDLFLLSFLLSNKRLLINGSLSSDFSKINLLTNLFIYLFLLNKMYDKSIYKIFQNTV